MRSLASPATLLSTIGHTPLLRLQRLAPSSPNVEVYAKAEFLNPGGSVKDRAALAIVQDGERRGLLHPGATILDATSGNTGIAYAMIATVCGYRLKLCVPENVSPERLRILRAHGAEVVLTSAMRGTDGAIEEARRLYASDPGRYFHADQYNNDANWRAHYDTTGAEIFEQTGGRVTHFVAGLGTSGTFVGAGRRLRAHSPDIRLISVQPESPLHGIEGLKHMPTAIRPGIYDATLADEEVTISTERAQELTRRLALEEGLLVGVSSGAALAAAIDLAERIREGVIVTVFPDSGTRYLTDRFWVERSTTVIVPRALQAIRRHGTEAFPEECCGALIAVDGIVVAAFPLSNVVDSGAARRFRIGPDGYRLAEARARELGGALAGFYHSHPNAPARPSAHDLEQAWPNLTYLIIAVHGGEAADVTVWRLREDRSGFEQGELTWHTGS
jgi:cysteine synthase B